MQDWFPGGSRQIHDPLIRKELGEVSLDGGRRRAIGCAQIDQYDGRAHG